MFVYSKGWLNECLCFQLGHFFLVDFQSFLILFSYFSFLIKCFPLIITNVNTVMAPQVENAGKIILLSDYRADNLRWLNETNHFCISKSSQFCVL